MDEGYRRAVTECVFCGIVAGTTPCFEVYADDDFLAFLDTRPVFPGHVLVIPKPHVPTLADLPNASISGYFGLVQRLAVAVERGLSADGTFVAINNKISQSVPHLHTHVVPRRKKDGLRGFFWPRTKYASDLEAKAAAEAVAGALGVE
jgi:histidine triad (HIT) family protein